MSTVAIVICKTTKIVRKKSRKNTIDSKKVLWGQQRRLNGTMLRAMATTTIARHQAAPMLATHWPTLAPPTDAVRRPQQ